MRLSCVFPLHPKLVKSRYNMHYDPRRNRPISVAPGDPDKLDEATTLTWKVVACFPNGDVITSAIPLADLHRAGFRAPTIKGGPPLLQPQGTAP
jgi:hypothetical protein